ncbi:MAG: tRNA pseudouridine(38-40) synthase TruA, partial [Mycobacteriales bacterium]
MTHRVRLDVAYDGSGFHGWARQPGRRTVAGELETALGVLARGPVRTVVAGRTDSGVHATGQVVHADLPAVPDVRRLNGLLDPAVRVRAATVAPAGFDARFSALSRVYVYRVTDSVENPLRRHDTLAWPRPLDLERLRTASRGLVGAHDFAAFCRQREGASTIRTLLTLDWSRDDGATLTATLEADAFCHSMVRSLVGAMLPVGDGRRDPSWPAVVLAAGVRTGEAPVAPAHGLTL